MLAYQHSKENAGSIEFYCQYLFHMVCCTFVVVRFQVEGELAKGENRTQTAISLLPDDRSSIDILPSDNNFVIYLPALSPCVEEGSF